MGLTFKPSKCRSLSICRGKPKPVLFYLTGPVSGSKVALKTLEDDPFKFLTSTVTFYNNHQDHLIFLKEKITYKLSNLGPRPWSGPVGGERTFFSVNLESRF